MSKLKLAIVIGSIRPNSFGGHAAQWIEEVAGGAEISKSN
jgi:NAD(P)H-dependent FMN reductase